jgi:hypothetical protein
VSGPAMIDRVIEEVRRVPEDRLAELYDFVHFFRKGLEAAEQRPADPMRFAGAWADMPEGEFLGLLSEITERRKRAFSRRRVGE